MSSQDWQNYKDFGPPISEEVWAYNDNWCDEYTPSGIRIGTQIKILTVDGYKNYFYSAHWITGGYTTSEQQPQKWKQINR